jgi:hypothetical protein
MYTIMAIAGAVIWIPMTVVYALKFKQGIKARKWFGVIAYFGLALLIGGLMEKYKALFENISPVWVFGVLILVIYLTAKIYIFNNIEY